MNFKQKKLIAILILVCVALGVVLAGTLGMGKSPVFMSVLVVLQILIALLLHDLDFWFHGVLMIADVFAGIALDSFILVILFVILYIVVTISTKYICVGEK